MALIELDHFSARLEAQLKSTPDLLTESCSTFNKVQVLPKNFNPAESSDTLNLSLPPLGGPNQDLLDRLADDMIALNGHLKRQSRPPLKQEVIILNTSFDEDWDADHEEPHPAPTG